MYASVLVLSLVACRKESPAADPEFSDTLTYLLSSFDTGAEADLAFAMRDLEARIHSDMDLQASNPVDRSLLPSALAEADVADIERENTDRDLGAAIPVAVAGLSAWPVEAHVALQLMPDQRPIEPYSQEKYDRSFIEGEDCFEAGDCEVLRTTNDQTKDNLLMTLDYILLKDFRWVDLSLPDPSAEGQEPTGEPRMAMLARSWTDRSWAGRSGNSFVHQSYTVEVWLPQDSGSLRLQSLWSETEFDGLDVSDDMVIGTTRSGIDKIFATAEDYLAEN
jgi:hypothetical protein